MINMVNSSCEYSCSGGNGPAFHEEKDKDKYVPDGKTIAYVRSNFCEMYHKDYMYLKNEAKDSFQSIIRDELSKKKKKSKEFASSITFGVIYEDNIYEARVFRKENIGISGLSSPDKNIIINIINRLLDYINNIDPELDIKLVGEPRINLCNSKFIIPLPPSKNEKTCSRFNLYLLNELIREKYNTTEYWLGGNYSSLYNGSTPYFSAKIIYNSGIHLIKFFNNGKGNIFGGSDEKIVAQTQELFVGIVMDNYDYVVQPESIPAMKTIKTEYEY